MIRSFQLEAMVLPSSLVYWCKSQDIFSDPLTMSPYHGLINSPYDPLSVNLPPCSQPHPLFISPSHGTFISPSNHSHRVTLSPSLRLTLSPSHNPTLLQSRHHRHWQSHCFTLIGFELQCDSPQAMICCLSQLVGGYRRGTRRPVVRTDKQHSWPVPSETFMETKPALKPHIF